MDKKVALVALGVAAVGVAVAVTRAREPEGPAPSGELTLEVLEPPLPYDIGDVMGQALEAALVRLTGRALTGVPLPDMVMEIYDNGVLRASTSYPAVNLFQDYLLDEMLTIADLGSHSVHGVMTLTNSVDTIIYQTDPVVFIIGEAPTGEISITVTPQ